MFPPRLTSEEYWGWGDGDISGLTRPLRSLYIGNLKILLLAAALPIDCAQSIQPHFTMRGKPENQ